MKQRKQVLTVGFVAIGALMVAHNISFTPRILYNGTPSVPIGFYTISTTKGVQIGDLMAIKLPQELQYFARKWHYIGHDMPLLKHVMALEGDEICSINRAIRVNGLPAAKVQKTDSRGYKMPHWQGCFILKHNEFFALNPDVQTSFDGRYFGILSTDSILGRAIPLWIFGAETSFSVPPKNQEFWRFLKERQQARVIVGARQF